MYGYILEKKDTHQTAFVLEPRTFQRIRESVPGRKDADFLVTKTVKATPDGQLLFELEDGISVSVFERRIMCMISREVAKDEPTNE